MNLDNLKPDTSSKISFFMIILIMGIFGFIQDFIFSTKTSGNFSKIFLFSFILFSAFLYLIYRVKIYRDFYINETSQIKYSFVSFLYLFLLILFMVSPSLIINYVGFIIWALIFGIVVIGIFIYLFLEIRKYKLLIKELINIEISHYNSKIDEKIKKYIIENKEKKDIHELIITLKEFGFELDRVRTIVHLMATDLPLI